MRTIPPLTCRVLVACCCAVVLASTVAYAQKDTVEFKFIPRYYPQDEFLQLPPPEIAYSPKILHPDDPELRDRGAEVRVNVLVNRNGIVGKAEIFRSTDVAFNEYAIEYARQYRFRWSGGWPEELKDRNDVWISIAVHFAP